MILNKKSHLILGSAGCGKSTLIKKIQEELKIQDKITSHYVQQIKLV